MPDRRKAWKTSFSGREEDECKMMMKRKSQKIRRFTKEERDFVTKESNAYIVQSSKFKLKSCNVFWRKVRWRERGRFRI